MSRPETPEREDSERAPALEALAARIADGAEVDWRDVESSGEFAPGDVAALEQIARLHDSHRELVRKGSSSSVEFGSALVRGFELHEEIGHGAFGRVWRATDLGLQRTVALKILDRARLTSSAERERFIREARLLASLRHENIVRIWSIDELDGVLRLSLEHLDGVTLKDLVEAQGPLSAGEAARIGADLCRALAAIHAKGLVHRDVKPANAMRESGGRIVLLDFGLADSAAASGASAGGGTPGTPLLMAPEQRDHPELVGPSSDLYALGVSMYWLVSGKYPWDSRDFDELFEQKRRGEFVPLVDRRADVPAEFADLLRRAIDPDPARRFASAGEFEQALRGYLAERGELGGEAPGFRLSRRALLAAGAAGAAVIAGIVWWVDRATARPLQIDCELLALPGPLDLPPARDSARPLEDSAEVRVGDRLVLRASSDREAWFYVFNEDGAGGLFALFPLPGHDLSNPLPARPAALPHELPGTADGKRRAWEITSQGGGRESFIVIASASPFPAAEELWSKLSKPEDADRPVTLADLDPRLCDALRGGTTRGVSSTVAVAANAAGAPGSRLSQRLADLILPAEDGGERDPDRACWVLELRNVTTGR